MASTSSFIPPRHSPPLVAVDETHQRAQIIIATSILLFFATLFVGARLWVRCNPEEDQKSTAARSGLHLLAIDDYLVIAAAASESYDI